MPHMTTKNEKADIKELLELMRKHEHFVGHCKNSLSKFMLDDYRNCTAIGVDKEKTELARMLSIYLDYVGYVNAADEIGFSECWMASSNRPLADAFYAGFALGVLSTASGPAALQLKTILSASAGRINVFQKRWNAVNTIKQKLVEQAESMWSGGNLLLHNEMADELLELDMNAAEKISKPVLLAALRPIAAKYGKVRGVKGIRKEKLPPK